MAKKGYGLLPIVAALMFLAAGCGDSTATPTIPEGDAELTLGEEIYTKNCSRCHLNNGGGGSGPQLNDGRVLEVYPEVADQTDVVANGRGRMPSFSNLSEEELDAVVRYTREILAEEK